MSQRKRYSPEYKRELGDVVRRSQSSCRQIAREVGGTPTQLSRWVREAAAGGGKAFPGGGTPHDEEMARLKRELSKVTRERDFLKDAAAYFAKQSPSGTR
jgi:transposase